MKILIVEDDFASRKMLQKILSEFGESDCAVDGKEALWAFSNALGRNEPYDLVCLDIMLPQMDGSDVLKAIRKIEEARGILGLDGVKVVMTTALGDSATIMKSFRNQCEGYITKPVTREKIMTLLRILNLYY
jgi:two-component system, chemotaxis family, chemotaxis protein CheY